MPDINRRLSSLDLLSPPDLWDDIRTRRPRGPRPERPMRRIVVAVLALVVSAAAVAFAVRAFVRTSPDLSVGPSLPVHLHANGDIAFIGGEQPGGVFVPSNVFVTHPDGTGLRQLTRGQSRILSLAWSPDGTRLAFVRTGGEFPPDNIFVVDIRTGHVTQLTTQTSQYEGSPAWSPDGSRIAFARRGANGSWEIYTMRPDGTDVGQLTHGGGNHGEPAWSPDGTRIAFTATAAPDSGGTDVYVMQADGTGVRRVTATPTLFESDPQWTPDGSRLSFLVHGPDDRPPDRILSVGEDGSDARTIHVCGRGCGEILDYAWAPDGRQILFTVITADTGNAVSRRLYVMAADGTGVRLVPTGSRGACCGRWQPLPGP